MGYRILFLANPIKLSVKNEQLVIDSGSVRMLVITEKQYEKIELVIGNYVVEEEQAVFEQLSIF